MDKKEKKLVLKDYDEAYNYFFNKYKVLFKMYNNFKIFNKIDCSKQYGNKSYQVNFDLIINIKHLNKDDITSLNKLCFNYNINLEKEQLIFREHINFKKVLKEYE